ncbi:unnamed protein product, partial [marine sediment metagenome]
TVRLGLDDQPDFATVTAGTGPTWNVWGSYKGSVTAGTLFTITPADGAPADAWTGDMSVVVTIANAHELVAAYRILVFEIEVWDLADDSIGTTEYLTMGLGEISIEFTQATAGPYTVEITGGYYITHRGSPPWTTNAEDPLIMCQVLQREAP